MRLKTPARDGAVRYLQSAADDALAHGRSGLPPIRHLAASAGVSLVTMWKAVQALKAAGVVSVSHRTGIVVAPAGARPSLVPQRRGLPASPMPEYRRRLPTVQELSAIAGLDAAVLRKAIGRLEQEGVFLVTHGSRSSVAPVVVEAGEEADSQKLSGPETTPKWKAIRASLAEDLERGLYPSASVLPTPKELELKYGGSYRTLRKALAALVKEGRITQHSRGYCALPAPVGRFPDTVALIARADQPGALLAATPRMQPFLRELDSECSRVHVRLALYPADYRDNKLHVSGRRTDLFARSARAASVLGCLVITRGIGRSLADLVLQLARTGKPVSVLKETDPIALPLFAPNPNNIRVFSMAGSRAAGAAMGRYLLGLGHRRVAYISPVHGNAWSRERFSGLEEQYRTAGIPDAVRPFTADMAQVLPVDTVQRHVAAVSAAVKAATMAEGDSLLSAAVLARLAASTTGRTAADIERHAIAEAALPLLDQALAQREISAWVGANDSVALECLRFLSRHGVRVPRDISVAGFDDIMDAFLNELTSYDFGYSAAARAMVAHVLGPSARPHPPRRIGPTVEIEGYLAARSTVRKIAPGA